MEIISASEKCVSTKIGIACSYFSNMLTNHVFRDLFGFLCNSLICLYATDNKGTFYDMVLKDFRKSIPSIHLTFYHLNIINRTTPADSNGLQRFADSFNQCPICDESPSL